MYKCFFIFIILLSAVAIHADFVENYPVEHIQPDGTKQTLYVSGDEFYRSVSDENGYTVIKHPESGFMVYADKREGIITPTSYAVGQANPFALGIEQGLKDDVSFIKDTVRPRLINTASGNDMTRITGTFNNLVVCIKLADDPDFPYPPSYYNGVLNDNTGAIYSVRQFFLAESNNTFNFQSYIFQVVINANPLYTRDYLSPYSIANPDGYSSYDNGLFRLNAMLGGVINYLDGLHLSLPDLDMDNDGDVDNVTFILSGGLSMGSYGDILWPGSRNYTNNNVYLDGDMFRYYNIVFYNSSLATLCHETSHSLGFPNLHRSDFASTPVGYWDVMGTTNPSGTPSFHLAYMKKKYGNWGPTPTIISAEGYYELDSIWSAPYSSYRINSTDPSQYYMVEYRRQTGPGLPDSSIPGTGLVVYRINLAADGEGNYDGPPDEVLVYGRYSQESGSTAIHQYTSPAPFLQNGSFGGLVILHIGNTQFGPMQFFLKSSMPHVWSGDVNSDWNNASNWINGVPGTNEDAYIPPVSQGDFLPVLIGSMVQVDYLHIEYGASLTTQTAGFSADVLYMHGLLSITGALYNNVNGNVYWGYGSTANVTNNLGVLQVGRDMYFGEESNINLNQGVLNFVGATTASIYVYAPAVACSINVNKTNPAYLQVHATSTDDLTLCGNLLIQSGKTLINNSPQTLNFSTGGILNYSGIFANNAGTVRFQGESQVIFNNNVTDSYFNNFTVNTMYETNFATPIKINGNLDIITGILKSNSNSIYVGGNWTNNVGTIGFDEGTSGQVIFSGSADQTCSDETFHTLIIDKPSGNLVIPVGSDVVCASYDWNAGGYRVDGGSFETSNLTDTGIQGNITLNSGVIWYNFIDNPGEIADLRGNVTINSGSFIVMNDGTACNFTHTTPPTLTMTGGLFDFKYSGINVSSTGSLNHNLTGGVIRTSANFSITRTDFNPAGGTVELVGSDDITLTIPAGSSLYNITVNKAGRDETNPLFNETFKASDSRPENPTRTNTVTVGSNLLFRGSLTISGGSTLNAGAYNIQANNRLNVYGTLTKTGAGNIDAGSNFLWYNNSVGNLSNCTLSCGGNWAFFENSTVNLSGLTTTFYGSGNKLITSSSPYGNFGTLILQEASSTLPATYTLAPESTSDLLVASSLTINPYNSFYLNGKILKVNSNLNINDNSKLQVNGGAVLGIGNGGNLNANNGGTLEVLGEMGHYAKITRRISTVGSYAINIESGGNISANRAIFEYMNSLGVNVKSGANVNLVNSFNYCTFRFGTSGTNGRLLTLNNSQAITVYGADFPTNTGDGNYNVAKTVTVGTATFYNYSGIFGGENYDLDNNARITWSNIQCDLQAFNIAAGASEFYVCESMQVDCATYNGSANPTILPVRIDIYYNRPTAPLPGEIGDDFGYLNPLSGMDLDYYDFEPTTSEVPGIWYTWMQVDALDEIDETNETNNVMRIDDLVTWMALPAVQNATISYDEQTGQINLNWTYPPYPSINQYKIYRGTSPQGPFDTLAGTSGTTSFSETGSVQRSFYKVKAEKTWP